MKLNQEIKGISLVAASAFLYGFLYYFGISIIRENYSPFVTIFWRFLIAAIFLLLIILPKLPQFIQKFSTKQILQPLLTSAPLHGIATSLYFIAASLIGGGIAEVLLFTHPITVMIFNRLVYKNNITNSCYISILCIIIGTVLLADLHNAKFNFRGILIGISSGIFFGLYIVSSKKNSMEPIFSALLICFGSCIVCLFFTLFHHSFTIPTSLKIWIHICALAVISTAIPILLFQKGLKFISSEKAAIISMIEPPVVILISFILLNEKITILQMIGSSIILASALIVSLRKKN